MRTTTPFARPACVITLLSLAAACCCGGSDAPADASVDVIAPALDAAPPDASAMRFFPPVLISELNTALDERSPALAADGTALYFARTELVSGFNVNVPYVARRANTASDFRPAVRAAAFGTISISDFEMRPDELEWLYWRGLGQVAVSARADSDDGWSPPLSLGFDGFSPSLTSDALTLYTIALDGTVRVRERTSLESPWMAPRIEPIPFAETINAIDISRDSLTLLITSSSGVFLASRDAPASLFSTPALLFAGRYENARFGASDQLITLVTTDGPNRELAIAAQRASLR